jgi:hypothetical protein
MEASQDPQLALDFQHGTEGGLEEWQERRRQALRALAAKLGLPLGHEVELWLQNDLRLRGRLELKEQKLFIEDTRDLGLELRVGAVTFTSREIQSCVRLG